MGKSMKHKKVVSVVALLGGCAAYWYVSSEPAPTLAQVDTSVQAAIATAPSKVVKPMAPKQVTIKETLPESMSERFSLLAQAYAKELSLPAYSLPIGVDDVHILNPNRYVSQPVLLEGGASASIIMPQYRFSFPQPVTIMLEVNGLTATEVSASIYSEMAAGAERLAEGDMALDGDGKWTVRLDATPQWDGPMAVNVTFSAKGKKQTLTTGIEYSYPTATVTGVGAVHAEGHDMVIPVKLEVEKAGYYRLRANLYAANQQPVALLTQSEKLSEGSAEITLKAYKGVLPDQDGEFTLGSFVLERRPAVPGELTRYGSSNEPSYNLGEFAVQQLSDEPWQPDEQEMQRLEFLQKMANE